MAGSVAFSKVVGIPFSPRYDSHKAVHFDGAKVHLGDGFRKVAFSVSVRVYVNFSVSWYTLRSSVRYFAGIQASILHELAGGSGLHLPMCMRNAIDGCVDVGVSKRHIECDRPIVARVGTRVGDNFRLVRTRPCFAPGYLACLTCFPTDCSG